MKLVKSQVINHLENSSWHNISERATSQFHEQVREHIAHHVMIEPRCHTWEYIQDKLWGLIA